MTLTATRRDWFWCVSSWQGKHDEEIAKAKDVVEIREAIIINEATFVDIIAAGNVQTRPVIEKTPAGDSGCD